MLEIVTKGLDDKTEYKIGVVQEEDGDENDKTTDETDLTDSANAILDTSEDRHSGDSCNHPDDDYLDRDIIARDIIIENVKTFVDLNGAKSKTGADTKESCNDRD